MENLIKRMMIEEPFYGFLLTTVEREYSDKVPTAAVCFDSRMNARLLVNKNYFDKFSDTQKLAILKHEMMHLAFKHPVLRDSFPDDKLFNIAADLEVNGYIEGLPSDALFPSDYGFRSRQGTSYYYSKLSANSTGSQGQQGGGSGNDGDQNSGSQPGGSGNQQDRSSSNKPDGKDVLDDHSLWEQGDYESRELANELINNKLLTAVESLKGRGVIPGEMQNIIADLQKPLKRVFDWKRMLRRFIGNVYDEKKKSSRRKESRRFAGSCGSKHMKKSRVLVGIDTSGSVSNQEVHEFVSELTYMYKAGTEIYVLECDALIHKKYWFKPGCIEGVTGRGGTSFDPVVNYYREHYKQFDTLIYLTDGEAPYSHLKIPQDNMLWVISSRGSKGNYPGKTLYIPKRDN